MEGRQPCDPMQADCMLESIMRHSAKAGLAPGTAAYAGNAKNFTPTLLTVEYTETSLTERTEAFPFTRPTGMADEWDIPLSIAVASGPNAAPETISPTAPADSSPQAETPSASPSVVSPPAGTPRPGWLLLLTGIHEVEQVQVVADWFGLHPLAVEDILNTGHRPSLDEYDDHVVMTMRYLLYDSESLKLREQHMALVCREDAVIGFQEDPSAVWEGVLGRLRKGKGRIRRMGTAYLGIAMLDALVDSYFGVLGAISADVQELEDRLGVGDADEQALRDLYTLMRTVVALRNALQPTQQALGSLHMNEAVEITPDMEPFLADVKGHVAQAVEGVQTLHELLSSMLNLQISLAGMRMNKVMKVLTIIATIFIPLTFIAGVYGMNFQNMPELTWRYGYFITLGLMGAIGAVMIYFFIRNRWL